MTQPNGTVVEAPALSFPQRVVGVFFSPKATFESVVAHPKWFDVLALGIVAGMLAWGAFFFWSANGSQIFLDQMVSQAEAQAAARGGNAAQAAENATRFFPFVRGFIVFGAPIIGPLFTAAIAGLLFGVFAVLGGGGSYKQVFAIVAHAGLPFQAFGLAELALQYARGSMAGRLTFGAFVQMLPEDSFVFLLLNAISLGLIWYLVLLAIGLAVLYRRKTATIATTFLGLYFVIAVIIAVVKSRG